MGKIYFEKRAKIFKAMAHPARLQILEALRDEEKCVYELQRIIGSAMPTVSRHLMQLKNAGIIADRRNGNQIYYRLIVPCILKAFDCIDGAICQKKGAGNAGLP